MLYFAKYIVSPADQNWCIGTGRFGSDFGIVVHTVAVNACFIRCVQIEVEDDDDEDNGGDIDFGDNGDGGGDSGCVNGGSSIAAARNSWL